MIARKIVQVVCVLAASSPLLAQAPMRDGLWEITTQMEMPNMPMKMPPEGNKASWKIACTGREKMTGVGEVTYKGDTYDGQMKLTMSAGEMTMKYTAKRLGECTK